MTKTNLTKTTSADLVTLVDKTGQVTGEMDKIEAHRGSGQLHLACSVYLFRRDNQTGEAQLLIQQRSPQKITGQKQWANTVCGNVRPGETPLECAKRRLNEELNITDQKLELATIFYYQTVCNSEFSEHELDHLFVGWYRGGDVLPNPTEAVDTKWLNWPSQGQTWQQSQWQDFLTKQDFAIWFQLMVLDEKVRLALYSFITR